MESRPNQHRPTPDQGGVPERGQHQPGNNEADFQSPQSLMTTKADRKTEKADKKAARKKEREQEAQEKRAKAEQFRETHQGTSLAKANQVYNLDESPRSIKLGRKVSKFTKARPYFNPNPTTKG